MSRILVVLSMFVGLGAPAFAQDPPKEWVGEGAFNAGTTQGNTHTTDVGAGLKLKHTAGHWAQSAEISGDYGKINGVETKNRIFAAGEFDYLINDRLSAYGRLSAEKDDFSGFDARYYAGVGVGYQVINQENMQWALQGGVGYKVDQVALRRVSPTVTVPKSTEESFSVQAASRFKYKINDKVALTNDTDVLYSDTSTQTRNIVALTVDLMGNLQARMSYDIRNESNPPVGFKATDTATKFSLVYKIG